MNEAQRNECPLDRLVMPVFNSDWRKACSVRECSITEVDGFIKAGYPYLMIEEGLGVSQATKNNFVIRD